MSWKQPSARAKTVSPGRLRAGTAVISIGSGSKPRVKAASARTRNTSRSRALWNRALDPWWNLQAGLRQDFGTGPDRTYAVLGVKGLAPYWFEIDGALFVSNKGDVTARIEAEYDQRLTRRLVPPAPSRTQLCCAGCDRTRDRLWSFHRRTWSSPALSVRARARSLRRRRV